MEGDFEAVSIITNVKVTADDVFGLNRRANLLWGQFSTAERQEIHDLESSER